LSSLRFLGPQPAPPVCPACDSTRVHLYPASRSTQRSVLGCRACGLRAWAERSTYSHDLTDPGGALTFDYAGYVGSKREGAAQQGWTEALALLRQDLDGRSDLSLFDVGAGDGEFLALAREAGFAVSGNELHPGAIALAAERYGVDLQLGELGTLGLVERYDALTMWCVLAHVEDVGQLLEDCWFALKPGGTLFLQTPRWTRADRLALSALRASGGRVARIVDRRVAEHHWQLHTADSVTALLQRHGFAEVRAFPKQRYSLTSSSYLESLGVPAGIARVTGRAMDAALTHGPAPRIVLDVLARKPG
jgi:2-polyprenyl-3-methyl-5-hydroxy-6-metoxy-1,4-benzoquinol methylase